MIEPKELVRRLVAEAMNGRDLATLDDLCTPALAPKLSTAFTQFLTAFPDWHQELVELVAEGSTVVARFRCTGTHSGTWQGLATTGRTMRIDEVYFFRIDQDRIAGLWGLEDTWTRMRQLAGDHVTLGELGPLSSRLRPVGMNWPRAPTVTESTRSIWRTRISNPGEGTGLPG